MRGKQGSKGKRTSGELGKWTDLILNGLPRGPARLGIRSLIVSPLVSGGCRVEIYAGKRSEPGTGERLVLTILPGKVQARLDTGIYKPNGVKAIVSLKKLRIAYPQMIESGMR